ncbi:MAG TPA: alpha/beta fold hydrolase, partial [Tepidiformaceae bacterium]|nr:alpha/beta fold hydrolase [Tepidiformaceae bacterium]
MPATLAATTEPPAAAEHLFIFDEYEVDTRRYELRRCGEPVPVEPQVFEVLAYLVRNADRIVSKDELLDHVWPDRYVTEAALNSRLMTARKAIGDSGQEQRYIKTTHGRGYRFIGTLAEQPAGTPPATAPALRVISSDESPAEVATPGSPPPVRYARTRDGVSIAYSITGDGPPLVRVLGWFTHLGLEWRWDALRGFWESLGANHSLVRFDGRGMGLSETADDFSLETRLADLEAVIDDAGLDRFALLGMCEGADTALHYAVRHAERVTHIVTYGAGPSGEKPNDAEWNETWNTMLKAICNGWTHPSPVFRQLFAHVFLGASAPQDLVERFDEIQRESVAGERAYRYLSTLNEDGLEEAAAAIRVPTLVIHRRNDPIVPVVHSQRLASVIPGARLVALEGDARW